MIELTFLKTELISFGKCFEKKNFDFRINFNASMTSHIKFLDNSLYNNLMVTHHDQLWMIVTDGDLSWLIETYGDS